MSKKNNIFLFTHSYPYGQGEQFLDLELKILADYYQTINLVPCNIIGHKRDLPSNNIIINHGTVNLNLKTKLNLTDYLLIFEILLYELIKSKHKIIYLKNLRYYISYIKNAVTKSKTLLKTISINTESVFYTYWFNEITFLLCILKRQGKINKIVTRAHGGDLYEHQHNKKDFIFPFRAFQLKWIDKVCPISKNGVNHLMANFKINHLKINHYHLASEHFGIQSASKPNVYTILSCSTFFSYKRIPFLINVLKQSKHNIHWIHIGDNGDEKEISKQMLVNLPTNITTSWLGYLDHKAVYDFYLQNPIHLFINVSSTEGIPVTLMEAISFGVPVMATDVGGVSELVNNNNGVLLDRKITEKKVAELIDDIIEGKIKLPESEIIREFWKNNYSQQNYKQFYEEVLCAV